MALLPAFGKAPTGERLERIRRSQNYRDGSFQNLSPTEMSLKDVSFFKILGEFLRKPANTAPGRPIPCVRTDLRKLPEDKVSVVWFGHSSYLIKVGGMTKAGGMVKEVGMTILVDPVFSRNAAPFRFFAKAFKGTDCYGVNELPDRIDMVLLTHDHYDHMDYKTIKKLRGRVGHFYTSLGAGSHLESWGIDGSMITELDWWEECEVPGVGTMTATPGRHFSGRSTRRNQTLWSSFVLKLERDVLGGTGDAFGTAGDRLGAAGYSFFLGGDSGYDFHFKEIGEKFGPFDLAILECGQYGKYWPHIHMFPEQTVQAAQDLKAKVLLPVHWAKFSLALHPWNEPIRQMVEAAGKVGQKITTPLIGQPVVVGESYPDGRVGGEVMSSGYGGEAGRVEGKDGGANGGYWWDLT